MLVAHPFPVATKALNRTRRAVRRAFTLMEILVVVAIIVVLAGLGTVSLMNQLETAKEKSAAINAKTIKNAATMFKTDTGNWPSSLGELVPKYLEKQDILNDPWGQAYQFQAHEDENNRTFYVWTTKGGKSLGEAPR